MALSKTVLKDLSALSQKKYREERQEFIVEGARVVREALRSHYSVLEVFATEEFRGTPAGKEIAAEAIAKGTRWTETSRRELEAFTETVHAQGVAALLGCRSVDPTELLGIEDTVSTIAAFDAVADPGNAGTMIRTCDWFGVNGIFLGANSVELHNPKVVRASMGSLFHLPVAEEVDLPSALSLARDRGYTVYVADASGEQHFDRTHFAGKSVIVFGNEAWGVSDQVRSMATVHLAIRRYGAAESLNVGVACGVILSGLHRLIGE